MHIIIISEEEQHQTRCDQYCTFSCHHQHLTALGDPLPTLAHLPFTYSPSLTTPSTGQLHQVAYEVPGLQVPELDGAIIAAGDDKVICELEAGDGTEVLVGTLQGMQTLARGDVPHLEAEKSREESMCVHRKEICAWERKVQRSMKQSVTNSDLVNTNLYC